MVTHILWLVRTWIALSIFPQSMKMIGETSSVSFGNCEELLKFSKPVNELMSGVALNQLVLKLPRSIQSCWGRHSYEQRPHLVNVADLATWLHKIEMGEKMVLASRSICLNQNIKKDERKSKQRTDKRKQRPDN